MGRTVYTREIAEVLKIEGAPLTVESVLEREQAIEKKWLEQFAEYKESVDAYNAFDKAKAAVADMFISVLRSKNVIVPSLNKTPGNPASVPDPEVEAELLNLAVVYANMGRDFEIIMQAVKDNPTLMSEWERFMMALRLAEN